MLLAEIHKQLPAFHLHVTLDTEPGEIVALLGASGSGKSLTLRNLAGLERPDSGRILLGEQLLYDSERSIFLPPAQRKAGYLFQHYALFPTKTVRENVFLGIRKEQRRQAEHLVSFWLQRMRLEGLEQRKPDSLSGGEQQRVALARILINQPHMLLLDEPFSALDGFLKWKLLWELRDDLHSFAGPVVLVTHDPEEVRRMASRVIVLDQGRSYPAVSVQDFFAEPEYLAACRLCGCRDVSPIALKESGEIYATDWGIQLQLCEKMSQWRQKYADAAPNWIALRPGALSLVPPKTRAIRLPMLVKQKVVSTGKIALWLQAEGQKQESYLTYEGDGVVAEDLQVGKRIFVWLDPMQVLLIREPV